SGDRDFLACGARDGSINLFALRIRRHIHSFRVHAAVSALSWDACAGDERTVFIGMKDCSVEGFTFNLNGKVEHFLVLPASARDAVMLITCGRHGILAITSNHRMIFRERKYQALGEVQISTTKEIVRQWSSRTRTCGSKAKEPHSRDASGNIEQCIVLQTNNSHDAFKLIDLGRVGHRNKKDISVSNWSPLHTAVFGPENLSDEELTDDECDGE
ncbi:hypothetical protein B0H14DRAFT_2697155, partial [Mycena olivaceomarginata]